MALSYQHEYHAGNHADILKHICLCLILESLCRKDKPFTVIDTHSGAGIFSLNDERLLKTGEAKKGIERLHQIAMLRKDIPHGIELYMQKEAPYIESGKYAGSPELERLFLREQDTLHLIEKHPAAGRDLMQNMGGSKTARIHNADCYETLKALTPPPVRRGLILCDPSFEDADDYMNAYRALSLAHKKWGTAIIALWYPILTRRKNERNQMLSMLENSVKTGASASECIRLELETRAPGATDGDSLSHMYGSGMMVINPPWQLKEEAERCTEFLSLLREQEPYQGNVY